MYAPDFVLPNVRELPDGTLKLYDVLEQRRAVLVFYRGGWCPMCSAQLASLSLRHADFQRRGLQLIAISNEAVEKGLELIQQYGPPFPLLHDPGSHVIEDFGVQVGRRDLLGFIKRKRDYARPSVFLIERNRKISWSYIAEHPADRPSIDAILRHADTQPGAYLQPPLRNLVPT